ncbi:g448 [Coccomyxa viridis]|uniref:G448 protein n=1 Tax=Coccomyxa viridis TaxID=1274662 RepID=A0ABP1FJS2_9CHLO
MKCCGFKGLPRRRKNEGKKHRSALTKVQSSSVPSPGDQPQSAGETESLPAKQHSSLSKSLSLVSRGSAFSDTVYHDAASDVDEPEGSGQTAGGSLSPDGSSPGPASTTYGSQEGDGSAGFFISPFALWARAKDSLRRSTSIGRRLEDPVLSDKVHPHNGLHEGGSTGAEAQDSSDSAILQQEGKRDSIGCIPMFQGPPKRFIRTIRPVAGSSFNKQAPGVGKVDGIECWEEAESTTFMVRGVNYMQDKKKVPSEDSMYRLLGCDVYSFDFKINHIARHIQLPAPPHLGPGAKSLPDAEQIPPLLVLNIQLPMYPASFFGKSDGHGHSLVYYFGLPDGWEPSMMDNKQALALWQRFVHDGTERDGQSTRSRLKLIPRVANVEQWAKDAPLSTAEFKLLRNYNDKPVLTRPQHRFYFGPNYMEIDLDIHAWAYLARKAFSSYIPRLGTVVFENAFVVQGNSEEELPELLLACARVSRVDFHKVRPFPAQLDMSEQETTSMQPLRFNERGSMIQPTPGTNKPLVATAI